MKSISVIMGVYRPDREMLVRAVESVLDQSRPPLECVLCDDGSGDDTFAFLQSLAARYDRLVILRHDRNKGLAAALNTCLAAAKGDYIARQDDDDYSAPGRFERQAAYLDRRPDIAVTGSSIHLYDDHGVWGIKRFPEEPGKRDFLFAIPFLHGTMMFRREAVAQHRYRVTRFTRRTEDYELLMRLYSAGLRGANLPEPLYYYREDQAVQARRKYRYRLDEAVIRAQGFSRLELMPAGLPYIVKPLVVGLIPQFMLKSMKKKHYRLEPQTPEPVTMGGAHDRSDS